MGLGVLAVAAGCAAAAALDRTRPGLWLGRLGGRTLPVYLVHIYPVLGVCLLLAPVADEPGSTWALLPPVPATLSIWLALGVHRLTRRVTCLWDPPRTARGGGADRSSVAAVPASTDDGDDRDPAAR